MQAWFHGKAWLHLVEANGVATHCIVAHHLLLLYVRGVMSRAHLTVVLVTACSYACPAVVVIVSLRAFHHVAVMGWLVRRIL